MAQFMAGFPASTCLYTCNLLCASGLQAVENVVVAIRAGAIEIGIAGGVEQMSQFDRAQAYSSVSTPETNPVLKTCYHAALMIDVDVAG